jgi:hypothetical protein
MAWCGAGLPAGPPDRSARPPVRHNKNAQQMLRIFVVWAREELTR